MILAWLLLAQGDLTASGVFKKVGKAWTAEKDVDVQDMKNNWVEREFQAVPGLKLYAWVRVGGCCRETLTAFCQVSGGTTEAKGKRVPIDPGGNMAAMLKLPPDLAAPGEHGDHGEKRPAYWLWVEVPLPAYEAAGARTIRLLTDQKGFSVERIHVGKDAIAPD